MLFFSGILLKAIFTVLVLVELVPRLVNGSKWDSRNDPSILPTDLNRRFSELPSKAQMKNQPWSDTYWPSMKSGIAHRWMLESNSNDFNYELLSQSAVSNMSVEDLKILSPAEKWDIYIGRYDFPTVLSEWQRTSPDAAGWEGICHGWAPAATFFKEPNPIVAVSSDGVRVPFGSSDIKALLSYYAGQYDSGDNTWFLSGRCNIDLAKNPEGENRPECLDMNAGTFHLLMTNFIGNDLPFVVDQDRSIQVWNQPAYKFISKVVETGPSSVANSSVKIITDFTYGKEVTPRWEPVHYAVTETWSYTLDLDEDGLIVGGDFTSWDRPDFAWMNVPSKFHGFFKKLGDLYLQSIGSPSFTARFAVNKVTMPEHHLDNHMVLFGVQNEFSLDGYSNSHKAFWSITVPEGDAILIKFKTFKTEHFFDTLRIYEGTRDELGALTAVLYGERDGAEVLVRSPKAFIVFESDHQNASGGFEAIYSGVSME